MRRRDGKRTGLGRLLHSAPAAVLLNLLLALAVWMATRVGYLLENWSTFGREMSWPLAGSMARGALVFDVSALLYVNALYLILSLLPLHLKERAPWWNKAMRWLFVVTNSLACASNLMDAVYFKYTGRRSTITVFSEFSNEGNIGSIIMTEFVNHWYLVVMMAILVWLLWRLFTTVDSDSYRTARQYYISQALALLLAAPLAVIGIRGSATAGTRPITVSNANQYVNRPVEAAVVLNTPFSMIRSIGKKVFVNPHFMTEAAMEAEYSPVQTVPNDSITARGRERRYNVVILLVESMGKEYIGAYNRHLDGGRYKGYMPFIDSLVSQSLTYKYSYANGRISMDAMPSALCGLPMMVEPLFLTPASLNDIEGLPAMLKPLGYSSAFFHGAHNISMGFSAFAHSIGFEKYYGLDEYCDDKEFGGMDDFDGKWAIWDEPFLQFTAKHLSADVKQPFVATVFTASSHHPYNLPQQYRDVFKDEGGQPIHKCVRYTDLSLRRFFERVSREPWYDNTIFVLMADHTNQATHDEYLTDLGLYSIPIILFTPDGSLNAAMRDDVIAQQADVMPTLLHLLGLADRRYLAFGCDLLSTPPSDTWAFFYSNDIYNYCRGDWMLEMNRDGRPQALYRFKEDPLLQHNLLTTSPAKTNTEATTKANAETTAMTRRLQALVQQYMTRMTDNRLLPNR